MVQFAKKISEKNKRKTIEKVIKLFRDHEYKKAESYLRKLPGDENRFEWLIKLQWTFGSSPIPEHRHIEIMLEFFERAQDPKDMTNTIELLNPLGDIQKMIPEAFRRLYWLLGFNSYEDWLDEINSLMEFPTAMKDDEGDVNVEKKTWKNNRLRQKNFENNLTDNIRQLKVLNEIFGKLDLIIKEIPEVKKAPGRSSEYPFLYVMAKKIYFLKKTEIEKETNFNDGTANIKGQAMELLGHFPELKRRIQKYKQGDKKNGVPFETVRSWVKKWANQDCQTV